MPRPPWLEALGRPLAYLKSHRRVSLLLALIMVVGGVSGTAVAIQGQGQDINSESAAATGDHTLTFKNDTGHKIWIGSRVNADGSKLPGNLPALDPDKSATITIPEHEAPGYWRGTFFARQGCEGQSGNGFHCAVGDCGQFADHCETGQQPTGLAEFNFDPNDPGKAWYDVSYVDGVAEAITITPNDVAAAAGQECQVSGCVKNFLATCPKDNLAADGRVCISPFRDGHTPYSDAVTKQCPTAYSWSKQDAEPGNHVMPNCTKCNGMTVTFHEPGHQESKPLPPKKKTPLKPVVKKPRKAPKPPAKKPMPPTRKGISLNAVDGATQALDNSGSIWFYNYSSTKGSFQVPKGTEYVPMVWGPGSVTDKELGRAKKEGKVLLGFNEPDSSSQANISPQKALDLWPRLQSTGMTLGAPAVSHDADKAGGWLDQFMKGAAKRHLRVDFIPLHWYGGDFGPDAANQLRSYLQSVYNRYHKPIWLTSYGLADYSGAQPRFPNQQQQSDFIKASIKMMDGLGYVKRYAWSTLSTKTNPMGLYDGAKANPSGQVFRSVF
ncbi:glycosyl hydrolase [Streptomyces sp. NPDC050560]|uniref:glycosyl hydrolase n=1 Tax=Streptomyces sp. NPDC050560 TaxID=3365630 RepID=UPI003788F668